MAAAGIGGGLLFTTTSVVDFLLFIYLVQGATSCIVNLVAFTIFHVWAVLTQDIL